MDFPHRLRRFRHSADARRGQRALAEKRRVFGKPACEAHRLPSISAISSSTVPMTPLGVPLELRQSARRIALMSAPCCKANDRMIAASRAFTSAPLLLLWLDKNSSPTLPLANFETVAV